MVFASASLRGGPRHGFAPPGPRGTPVTPEAKRVMFGPPERHPMLGGI